MIDDSTRALSTLALELHRACRDMPADRFQEWAMSRLRADVPFDSGLWASGLFDVHGDPIVHSLVLIDRPLELMADYLRPGIKDADHLAKRNVEIPGVVSVENSMDRHPQTTPALAAYMKKWRIVNAMACHTIDALTGLVTAVALWRERREEPFVEDERRYFEVAMPHLIETYGTSRLTHLERAAHPKSAALYASAAVDRHAHLQVAPPDFQRLLLLEWPQWRGHLLPEALHAIVDGSHERRFAGRHIAVRAERLNDIFLVQARPRMVVDDLTAREREVALLIASGMTYKEAAQRLGVAPATVRNHMSAIFAKLGIAKQSEMAAALRGLE
ncbi:MAG: helix-turn-helix transcriptional regulator [Betaproteobacteria bacterium]|nr:helix-turn-helix transcriptional regulator [Betaproteobacteria bacterium]